MNGLGGEEVTLKLTDVQEIRRNEDRIFHEVCEIVQKLKQKHPTVGYVVRLEHSVDEIGLDSEPPSRYSAWIFVSLNRNRTILESGKDSGEWPGACEEVIRVKSFFGKNKKTYRGKTVIPSAVCWTVSRANWMMRAVTKLTVAVGKLWPISTTRTVSLSVMVFRAPTVMVFVLLRIIKAKYHRKCF